MPRPHPLPTLGRLLLAALALGLTACASGRIGDGGGAPLAEGRLAPGEFDAQAAELRAELDAGRPRRALDRALALRSATGLQPEQANRAELFAEEAARAAVAVVDDPGEIEELPLRELPRRPRSVLDVGRARLYLERGNNLKAYESIERLERDHPNHPLRVEAGDVLAAAGVRMTTSKRRYLLIFKESARAPQVLEYLVLNHPRHPRCAEAYARLAEIYEANEQRTEALDRLQELLLYHPRSEYAVAAEARIPHLRLERLPRYDRDRPELYRARLELETWLSRHAGAAPGTARAELEATVRADLTDTYERLIRSDLRSARFYRTIEEPEGQRLHAERAVALASDARRDDLLAEARELLSEVVVAPLVPLPPAEAGS